MICPKHDLDDLLHITAPNEDRDKSKMTETYRMKITLTVFFSVLTSNTVLIYLSFGLAL